jgi:hypothetical protein
LAKRPHPENQRSRTEPRPRKEKNVVSSR